MPTNQTHYDRSEYHSERAGKASDPGTKAYHEAMAQWHSSEHYRPGDVGNTRALTHRRAVHEDHAKVARYLSKSRMADPSGSDYYSVQNHEASMAGIDRALSEIGSGKHRSYASFSTNHGLGMSNAAGPVASFGPQHGLRGGGGGGRRGRSGHGHLSKLARHHKSKVGQFDAYMDDDDEAED